MDCEEDQITTEEGWRREAEAVIADIKFAVHDIHISPVLPITDDGICLNVETKEHQRICVEMSVRGFKVVAEKFDCKEELCDSSELYYETPYSLLDKYSLEYRHTFGNALFDKLLALKNHK